MMKTCMKCKKLVTILDDARRKSIVELKKKLLRKKDKKIIIDLQIDGYTYRSLCLSPSGNIIVKSIFLDNILEEDIEGCSYRVLYYIMDYIDSYI